MNHDRRNSDDPIRALLVEAGPAPELPADDLDTIRRAARREWLGKSVTPIFEGPSYRKYLAMAASLMIVLAAFWFYRSGSSPFASAAVASVELLRAATGTQERFVVGDELAAGAELTTVPTERLALRMTSGHSVRLEANSRIRLASASRLELEYGAVYVDSGIDGVAHGLEVSTPLGTVREVGTQFEVRVDTTMRVRVREGSVALSHGSQTFAAGRGEQLTVDLVGAVERSTIAITGPDWAWVLETAPSLDVEGRPLRSYLDWISRETGWEVRFDDPSLEPYASETVYGTIDEMTPEKSLMAILPSARLGYRLEGDVLVIVAAPER